MRDIQKVYEEIAYFAKINDAKKVVLFGSRARGTNHDKSDIDLAVYGCIKFDRFKEQIDEELWSLLPVDVVNMDAVYVSEELKQEVQRDGVILYEKI